MLKAKIQKLTVTEINLDYEGSLEEARRKFRIPVCPSEEVDGCIWSRRIRR